MADSSYLGSVSTDSINGTASSSLRRIASSMSSFEYSSVFDQEFSSAIRRASSSVSVDELVIIEGHISCSRESAANPQKGLNTGPAPIDLVSRVMNGGETRDVSKVRAIWRSDQASCALTSWTG